MTFNLYYITQTGLFQGFIRCWTLRFLHGAERLLDGVDTALDLHTEGLGKKALGTRAIVDVAEQHKEHIVALAVDLRGVDLIGVRGKGVNR